VASTVVALIRRAKWRSASGGIASFAGEKLTPASPVEVWRRRRSGRSGPPVLNQSSNCRESA
jgi:hypothetical protein